MKVLVIGSGGREHALAWKLAESKSVSALFAAPGNPGMEAIATLVPVQPTDGPALAAFAKKEKIGLTVVGPEQPLADGIVDLFTREGLTIFGPTKDAAILEWSKAEAKEFMLRRSIPTSPAVVIPSDRLDDAKKHIETCPLPVVVKADGLAAGKGVIVCRSREEAREALSAMVEQRVFGAAADMVVIEQHMEGAEVSLFVVTDGSRYVTLAPAQDHKRALDGDRGKNTGGMGAHAPAPGMTTALLREIEESVVAPTLLGMLEEGRPYRGCLYIGLMFTSDGPRVVEFNCRFGDPETQVVLPLYDGDLAQLLLGAARGDLRPALEKPVRSVGNAVCVVLAAPGYPDAYPKGMVITGVEAAAKLPGIAVFHAGTARSGAELQTAGGRVLGVTAYRREGSLEETISAAYEAVSLITFEGKHFRKDIGKKAVAAGGPPTP